jgi:hypothetical protein
MPRKLRKKPLAKTYTVYKVITNVEAREFIDKGIALLYVGLMETLGYGVEIKEEERKFNAK